MAVKHSKNLKGYFDAVVKCADPGDKIYIDQGGVVILKKALYKRLRELIRDGVLAVDENDLRFFKKDFHDRYRTAEMVFPPLVGYIKL